MSYNDGKHQPSDPHPGFPGVIELAERLGVSPAADGDAPAVLISAGPASGPPRYDLAALILATLDRLDAATRSIGDTCGSPKGLQAVGESCNGNCGGRVIPNPQAEKEREGEAETCFALTCEKVATHDAPMYGHGRCLYCAEHAEGLPGARRLVREGDIIEKLREWVEAQVAEKRRVSDLSGGEHGGVEFALLCEVRDFLNDLQEQEAASAPILATLDRLDAAGACPLATPCENVRICTCGVDNRPTSPAPRSTGGAPGEDARMTGRGEGPGLKDEG